MTTASDVLHRDSDIEIKTMFEKVLNFAFGIHGTKSAVPFE